MSMAKHLIVIALTVLGLYPLITNMEKMCPKGTFLYESHEGTEACQNCTEGVNFMHYKRHRHTSCFDCTKLRNKQLEVLVTECNRTHDAVILCVHEHYRYKAKNTNEIDHCKKCSTCQYPQHQILHCQDIYDTLCCDGPNFEAVLNKDGVYVCRKLSVLCERGQYLDTSTNKCITCPSGTYMAEDSHNNTACNICQTLPNLQPHQVIVQACNSTHPTIIGCEDGYFIDRARELLKSKEICIQCRECQHLGRACNMYQDSVCCSEPHMIVVDTDIGPECRNHDKKPTEETTNTLIDNHIHSETDGKINLNELCGRLVTIVCAVTVIAAAIVLPLRQKIFQKINSMNTVTLMEMKLVVAEVSIAILVLLHLLLMVGTSSSGDINLWLVVAVLVIIVLVSVYTILCTFTSLRKDRVHADKCEGLQDPLIPPARQDAGSAGQYGRATGDIENFPPLTKLIKEYKQTKLYQNLQAAIEQGGDINATDDTNKTILMHAAEHGQTTFLHFLLSRNADVNMRDMSGNTALMYAAQNGRENCVKELVDFKAGRDIDVPNNEGVTPLMMAVSSYTRNENIPYLFIKLGADVHKRDIHGNTALIYAVKRGHAGWVKALIEADGDKDVNLFNKEGETAIMLVVSSYADDDKLLDILIQAGADVNVRDGDGNTLLALAGKSGNEKCVSALIEAGLTHLVNSRNTKGVTPLMLTVSSNVGNKSCPEILIHAGANIHMKDQDGNTALFHAVGSRNAEYVKVLIEAGAEVNVYNNDKNTPILLAASTRESNNWCVRLLLDAGADINMRDREGHSALDLAKKVHSVQN